MLMDSLFTDAWTSTFNKILCRQGFVIAKNIRLQGLLLLVYTQMKHITHLRDIEAQYTKTGLGGMWVSQHICLLASKDYELIHNIGLLIGSHDNMFPVLNRSTLKLYYDFYLMQLSTLSLLRQNMPGHQCEINR